MRHPPHTVVALSGGVDSAVSALRLLEAGHRIEAVFIKSWEEDDSDRHCAAAEDLADAERVCRSLGIELRTVNLATEYWDRVFERFLAEHRAGRTPNPDVWCNREIKFRELHDFVLDQGGERIATGHYARVERAGDTLRLLKGRDPDKDQTYFLYAIGQAALARSLFPVGELTKTEVRLIARRAGLANHARKGSTGICFIGERPFRAFLGRFVGGDPGPMRTPDGVVVGEHCALAFYTLGQRQGLGLGGARGTSGDAWYVVDKVPAENALVVAQGRDHPLLYSRSLRASEASWIAGTAPTVPFTAHAKTRYRQPDQPCRVTPLGDDGFTVDFARPQWAITPGQSVVLYDAEACLGGGIIEARY
jgi:tRNA-uridine 2-sulfurtransferase